MKKILFTLILLTIIVNVSCAKTSTSPTYSGERMEINFEYTKRSGLWSNQFVVWIEDDAGNYIKTIHATKDIAKEGLYKKREQALSNWRAKVNIESIPEDEIDSFSYATPKSKKSDLKCAWDLKDRNGNRVPNGTYKFFVEGTIYKDHNVVYIGSITIGANTQTRKIEAVANYSSENAKQSDMIKNVYAEYFTM